MTSAEHVMLVDKVWRLSGRHPIVTGPAGSSGPTVRVGDRLRLKDDLGIVHAVLAGVDLHMPAGQHGLVLSDADGELRDGQLLYKDSQDTRRAP